MALPWSRPVLRWYAVVAAVIVVITGMAVWGLHERHSEPKWYVGQHLTRAQARGVLRDSVSGLLSARLSARMTGEVPLDVRGTVAYAQPAMDASLQTVTISKPHRHVPLVMHGSTAWLHLHVGGHAGWARLAVDPTPRGDVTTTVSQIAGGIDLPRLFAGAEKGVRAAVYRGAQSADGVSGDVFQMRIRARALRRVLPSLLTGRPTDPGRMVVATFVLDPDGRLLRFGTLMRNDAIEVTILDRNPSVRVAQPAGTIVPLASVAPYL